jgi:hypothetical protein
VEEAAEPPASASRRGRGRERRRGRELPEDEPPTQLAVVTEPAVQTVGRRVDRLRRGEPAAPATGPVLGGRLLGILASVWLLSLVAVFLLGRRGAGVVDPADALARGPLQMSRPEGSQPQVQKPGPMQDPNQRHQVPNVGGPGLGQPGPNRTTGATIGGATIGGDGPGPATATEGPSREPPLASEPQAAPGVRHGLQVVTYSGIKHLDKALALIQHMAAQGIDPAILEPVQDQTGKLFVMTRLQDTSTEAIDKLRSKIKAISVPPPTDPGFKFAEQVLLYVKY